MLLRLISRISKIRQCKQTVFEIDFVIDGVHPDFCPLIRCIDLAHALSKCDDPSAHLSYLERFQFLDEFSVLIVKAVRLDDMITADTQDLATPDDRGIFVWYRFNFVHCHAIDFLNPRSTPYRKLGLGDRKVSKAEAIRFICSDVNFLKRPIVVKGRTYVSGMDEEAYRGLK